MRFLYSLVRWWSALNVTLLRFGRVAAWALLMGMVLVILVQIAGRPLGYGFSWSGEAAQAMMMWMMALAVPTAYRHAGFVAIETVPDMLPRFARGVLDLVILVLSLAALVVLAGQAWAQFTSPVLFNASGLNRLLQDSGVNALLGTGIEFRESYIYLAMSVGLWLLISVNGELILRAVGRAFAPDPNAREWFDLHREDKAPLQAE